MKKKTTKRKSKTNIEPEINLYEPFVPIVFQSKSVRGRFVLFWFFFTRALGCLFKGKASF